MAAFYRYSVILLLIASYHTISAGISADEKTLPSPRQMHPYGSGCPAWHVLQADNVPATATIPYGIYQNFCRWGFIVSLIRTGCFYNHSNRKWLLVWCVPVTETTILYRHPLKFLHVRIYIPLFSAKCSITIHVL